MKNEIKREIIVWLKDGIYRINVLKMLNDKFLLSSEIARELKIHRSSTSRLLKKLKDKELIKSVSSNSRTIEYSLTQKGKNYLNHLGE